MIHARTDYNRFQDPALDDRTLLGKGGTPIGEHEPVFLLRAQDKHAAKAVAYYAMLISQDPNVDTEMAAVCVKWASKMAIWDWKEKKSPDM